MRQKFLLLLSMVVSILFVGCTDPEPETVKATLALSGNSFNLVAEGANQKVSITSNTSWTVEVEQSAQWLTATPASGKGDAEMTITATENTAAEERTATVTVTAETLVETITITQAAIDTPPTPDEDDDTFTIGMMEMIYNGNSINDNTVEWDVYLYNDIYVASSGIRGEYMKLQLIGDPDSQTFRDGPLTGSFEGNFGANDSQLVAGDITNSGYGKGSDDELFYYFVDGNIEIANEQGNIFTVKGQFEAQNGTLFTIDHSLDITDNEAVSIQDQTYNSDIEEDYVQNITAVFAEYNGDALGSGNGVWKMHIWGDGATVTDENRPTNGEGTYVCLQFYAPLENMTPEGTYTVGANEEMVTGTIEPGHTSAAGYVGTWLYQMGDYYVTGMTPAISGELEIVDNGDGTHTVKYNFGDDNPYGDTKYFSGDYTGDITIFNRISTGDFNEEASSFTYYHQTLCDNNAWELTVVSNDYVESEGQNGTIASFILTTSLADTYWVDITDKTWTYRSEECDDDYSIYSGTVKTYTDGVESESAVNGGNISVAFAENNNSTFVINFNDISTVGGDQYDWLYFSEMERTDGTVLPVDDINMSEVSIGTANFEYYGSAGAFTNWSIALYSTSYFDGSTEETPVGVILDIYLDGQSSFEDGLPEGTYSFIPTADSQGVWKAYSMIKRGYILYEMVEGTVKVEKVDDEYKFTFDMQLDYDDAKLIGEYQGKINVRDVR